MELSLGTAQFGKKYGISNKYGKTTKLEVKKIFKICKENKLLNIDTAIAYRNVHNLIGNYNLNQFKISTKLPKISGNKSFIRNKINKKINVSLKKMKINSIDTLLLHNPSDLVGRNGSEIYQVLSELKYKKKINKIGVSVYSFKLLKNLIELYDFDVVQTPLNIIDNRILDTGMYEKLNSLGIEIEVRSIFLQGLLFLKYNKLPKNLFKFKKIFLMWNKFLINNNINSIDACMAFIKKYKKIKRIIIGCENSEQLINIINSFNSNKSYKIPNISSKNEKLINPNLW